jgi:hypothetical protein
MASANTAWTRRLPSAGVRQCPSKSGAIVTQFVTQADDHVQRAVRFSGECPGRRESTTVFLTRPDDLPGHLGVQDWPHVSTAVVSTALAASGPLSPAALTFRSGK